jgi:hypothetical protein
MPVIAHCKNNSIGNAVAEAEIQATGLAPPDPKESAIILVRPPGNTTAIVAGKNNTTGNALVEVYILPP